MTGAAALAVPVLVDAPAEGDGGSFGVLHGLYWLLANLAERGPLLLAIDDAHWADEPSLRFLAFLTRRVDSLPLVLLTATRPVEPDAADPSVLSDLLGDPATDVVTIRALSEPAVLEFLREHAGATVEVAFARACHHASGGNPFLLTELERTLREEGVPLTAAGAERVVATTPPKLARATRAAGSARSRRRSAGACDRGARRQGGARSRVRTGANRAGGGRASRRDAGRCGPA
ncbi:MAG: hypothetical protein JO286_11600 [Solirubrobacterales bacterium]|nr:hypothetical protein [Solirubrobacterales bacterium]